MTSLRVFSPNLSNIFLIPCIPFLFLLFLSSLESFFFFFYKFIFIFGCLGWVFIAAHGLSLVAASGGYSSLWCAGFSLWLLLLLWSMGSRRTGFSSCGLRALECRLSHCGAQA